MNKDKDILINEDHFKENKQAIEQAIIELDEFYKETKEHFDIIKNSRSTGSLSFVHLQTSNLISLKNAKFSLLKEQINIKKIESELLLKQDRGINEDTAEGNIINSIMKKLMEKDETDIQNKVFYSDDDEDHSIDSILEKRINKLEKDGELNFSDNENAIRYENQEVSIVVVVKNKKWHFEARTEDGKKIKDYPLPNKSNFKMKLKKDGNNTFAIDQDDKIYPVIKI